MVPAADTKNGGELYTYAEPPSCFCHVQALPLVQNDRADAFF